MFCKFFRYFFFFVSIPILAQQNMQEGFQLLETGKFQEAENFFQSYLTKHPENKTANICYGRAVGLSGEPQKANELFKNLLNSYPDDFEVKINYYESFLWDKKYKEAKPLFKKLVTANPTNFGAVLGYANTLSNLEEYASALEYINKAISLELFNTSAKVSRKYIKLGYANAFVNNQNYNKGKELLTQVFKDFPEDKEVLLNLANIALITKEKDSAVAIYKRLATSFKDSITALNGIALANHIGEKEKEALRVATIAKSKITRIKDSTLTARTNERYVQALIWNQKFKTSRQEIDSITKKYTNVNWVLALKATLGMYTGDFKTSIKNYDKILENDTTSFDGNLGKANALFASGKVILAYKAANKTLEIYTNQKDALGLIKKIEMQYLPSIEEHFAYTFDNGNNVAYSTTTTAQIPFSTKFMATASYQYRKTENTVTNNSAKSHVALAGLTYKIMPNVAFKSIIGVNASSYDTESYSQPILDVRLTTKPLKLQNLEVGYQREVQNFNADLIEREIVMNHYGFNYNLGTNINLGWYSQFIHTEQSDANARDLFFTSLYYSLLRKPAVKVGVNYQYIGFKEQLPNIYFSPESYNVVEIFAEVRGKIAKKTQYMASMATGSQKVENDNRTTIFRAETGLQHQFHERFSGNLYGKYSNIASATAAGFEFTEIGIKLKWLFTKKPLFYKQLK